MTDLVGWVVAVLEPWLVRLHAGFSCHHPRAYDDAGLVEQPGGVCSIGRGENAQPPCIYLVLFVFGSEPDSKSPR